MVSPQRSERMEKMTPENPTFESVTTLIRQFRDDRDWKKFHKPKDLSLAISVEASELAEAFLWKPDEVVDQELLSPEFREHLMDEVADVCMFLIYFCDATQIDLPEAISSKIKKNAEKYPIDKCRGSSLKYDQY